MKVRVVEAFERRALAWIVAVVGGVLTGAVILHMFRLDDLGIGMSRWWTFGAAHMLWCFGLMLGFRRRPYVADAASFAKKIGPSPFHSVLISRADRGYSVALTSVSGAISRGYFLEVERESEARKLLAAHLFVTWPGTVSKGVVMKLRRDGFSIVQRLLALVGFICAMMYGYLVGTLDQSDYKATFGLPAIICALISSLLFILDPLVRPRFFVGKDTLDAKGAVGDHLRIHAFGQVETADAGSEDNDEGANLDARLRVLDRSQEEPTAAWLKRIDALGEKVDGGYREATFSNEELERVARDSSLPSHARLGATRLLLRRAPDVVKDVHFRIADDADAGLERRARILLRVEDPIEAASTLEDLGPAFRMARTR